MRHLEEKLQRPLQWIICLLHFNELPFKHLFKKIDGFATGPEKYSGPIGRILNVCEERAIVSFEPIDFGYSLPVTNPGDLSQDQKYLYNCFYAIKSGECSEDLANRSSGRLNLSRWVTTANRILRLYMSIDSPSGNLKVIVNYIMRVYIPFWFKIKTEKSIKDGARHFHTFIQLTRYLDKKYLDIIDPVIARNSYFAHPENMLLSMISDSRPNIRQKAIDIILQARGDNINNNTVCQLRVPDLNFQAQDYKDMVDMSNATPPPVLSDISSVELILATDNKHWDFFDYPNHTQAVERTVKLVTEKSSRVCDQQNRNKNIRCTLRSRKNLSKNDNKRHLEQLVHSMDVD